MSLLLQNVTDVSIHISAVHILGRISLRAICTKIYKNVSERLLIGIVKKTFETAANINIYKFSESLQLGLG